jgi:hypothetical protein
MILISNDKEGNQLEPIRRNLNYSMNPNYENHDGLALNAKMFP